MGVLWGEGTCVKLCLLETGLSVFEIAVCVWYCFSRDAAGGTL